MIFTRGTNLGTCYQHLNSIAGAKVEATLKIHACLPDGVKDDVRRTVTENCRTLKFTNYGFEEE